MLDSQLFTLEEIHHEDSDVLRQRPAEIEEEGTWGEAVDISAFACMREVGIDVFYLNPSSSSDSMLFKFYPIDENGSENQQAPVLNCLVTHTGEIIYVLVTLCKIFVYYYIIALAKL